MNIIPFQTCQCHGKCHWYVIFNTRIYKQLYALTLTRLYCTKIGIPVEEVWEAYGGFLIQFTMVRFLNKAPNMVQMEC